MMTSTTTAPPLIYLVNTIVEVDNKKTSYIIEIDNIDANNVRFKIRYTVGNKIEEYVEKVRYRPVCLYRTSSFINKLLESMQQYYALISW